jgi:hypothetical protein
MRVPSGSMLHLLAKDSKSSSTDIQPGLGEKPRWPVALYVASYSVQHDSQTDDAIELRDAVFIFTVTVALPIPAAWEPNLAKTPTFFLTCVDQINLMLEFGPSARNQIKRGSAGSRPKRFHIHSVPRDFQFVHLISPHLSDRACLSYI